MTAANESLNALINMGSTACLNESSTNPFANCLVDDAKELRSDADEQLLLSLQFTEPVHVSGLHFAANGDEAPTTIKLFANKQNMGFDDADSEPATQEATLQFENEVEAEIQLMPLRFKNVHSLVLFVEANGGAELTSLRYLDVRGVRARGGPVQARAPTVGKRQKKLGNGAIGEVATRMSAQGSDEGVARCLLEVAVSTSSAQGRDIVRKASEVFLAAAADSGDQRRRALLLLGACRCQVLCLDRGSDAIPLPSATRAAMRSAVQGLMSALEGVVDAKSLRPLLESLISQKARGLEEAMHLFCRIVDPIAAPACARGQLGDESGDSESEASELDNDDDMACQKHVSIEKTNVFRGVLSADDAEKRAARIASLLETCQGEGVAGGEVRPAADTDDCLHPPAELEEFLAGMAIDVTHAAAWPVLYPGSGSHGFRFDSNFEGGNLRRVRLQNDRAVELLLNGDTNRSYHCQSFFFDVEVTVPIELRIRIVTFTKPGSTFAEGQKIVTLSPGEAAWRRDGRDYAYVPNRYMIGERRRHYTLAFTISLSAGRTRVAHFYPYLFGDLLCDLRRLRPNNDWLDVQDIGPTLGGRPLLMLTITDFSGGLSTPEPDERMYIVISARVHPGETPASFMMRGVLELLLSESEEAQTLRRRFKFVILPMLNPDGVAAGNGRANSAGYDLNRCWVKPPPGSEIVAARRVLEDLCSSPAGVLAFLDLHAHSRRHGAFTLSNPSTYALPDLLAEIGDPVFDRKHCVFTYNKSKRASARCVVWKDMGVTHAHTVEATYAALPSRNRLVSPRDLSDLGHNLVRACAKLEAPSRR